MDEKAIIKAMFDAVHIQEVHDLLEIRNQLRYQHQIADDSLQKVEGLIKAVLVGA